MLVAGPEALFEWREAARLPVPGHEFSKAYKEGKWDGMWMPGKWCRMRGDGSYEMRCSLGVAYRVLSGVGVPGTPLEVLTAAALSHPLTGADLLQFHDAFPQMEALREYQSAALLGALACRWGRVSLATNAGKGAIIALLAGWATLHQIPVLIACDEVAVFDALQGEIRQWLQREPSVVKAGTDEPPGDLIVLAMIPTLARRIDKDKGDPDVWRPWLKERQMLLLDEADKATAPQWKDVIRTCRASRWRIGFSGTFPRTGTYEDWQLEELMGPVISERRNLALVEEGISARPTITLAGFDVTAALNGMPTWAEWAAMTGAEKRRWTYEQAVVYNAKRHAAVAALVRPDTPTVIIVNRVDHGEQLKEAIPGSVFLDGKTSDRGRITALEAFRTGKYHVLIVTKILDRGTNRLGWARDVIFASGEGSTRQNLQRLGRGLRRADGKAELRLVDVIDRVRVHNPKTQKRLAKIAEYLHAAGRERTELYSHEGFQVEVVA